MREKQKNYSNQEENNNVQVCISFTLKPPSGILYRWNEISLVVMSDDIQCNWSADMPIIPDILEENDTEDDRKRIYKSIFKQAINRNKMKSLEIHCMLCYHLIFFFVCLYFQLFHCFNRFIRTISSPSYKWNYFTSFFFSFFHPDRK